MLDDLQQLAAILETLQRAGASEAYKLVEQIILKKLEVVNSAG